MEVGGTKSGRMLVEGSTWQIEVLAVRNGRPKGLATVVHSYRLGRSCLSGVDVTVGMDWMQDDYQTAESSLSETLKNRRLDF